MGGDPRGYEAVLDALPDPAWVTGPGGDLEYVSRPGREYLGLPLDDLLGWDWGWAVHPADLAAAMAAWADAVRTGRDHQAEFRLRRHDGAYRWFLARGRAARDPDGAVLRWFGTCTDVDDRRRERDELVAARGLFRALVERASGGMSVGGADHTIRYVNPAAAGLLGRAPGELAGTDARGWAHPDDVAALEGWLAGVVGGAGGGPVVARFRHADGSYRRLEVRAVNLLPDPDVRGLGVTVRAAD